MCSISKMKNNLTDKNLHLYVEINFVEDRNQEAGSAESGGCLSSIYTSVAANRM